jgi:hypothetical protein
LTHSNYSSYWHTPHVLSVLELGKVSKETVALWLLSLICSYHGRSKYTLMELNGIDTVFDDLLAQWR